MTFRICTAALLAMLAAPAHADAFFDQLPSDPARTGWRPPDARPYVSLVGNYYDFDPGRGPLLAPHAEDSIRLVGPGTWGQGTAPLPLPAPDVVTPCRPPAAVPGPLPIAGAAAAWGWARRLRRKVG